MTGPAAGEFNPVLELWFGELDERGIADAEHVARWWKKDESFDELLRSRFGTLHEAVVGGECDGWLESPRGRLAHVIVLDQFSRNMFRGTAETFAHDARALEVARGGVQCGVDHALAHDERGFLYMPFMHSEEVAAQERCVQLFSAWRDSLEGELRQRAESSVDFAIQHRDIVRRFGRFPHRNALLERESTPEEIEFLKQPGSSF